MKLVDELKEEMKENYKTCQESYNATKKPLETIKILTYTSNIAKNLMMDLLDLAQLENNTFKINKELFSLPEVIKNAFMVVQHIADAKKVALVSPDLKKEEAMYFNTVVGDQNRFMQVLVNFLSNSLKFSTENSSIIVHLKLIEN
jgi:signal transduction histidine kinase